MTTNSVEVLKYAAEAQELDDVQSKAADVNQDGAADSTNAAAILGYEAEKSALFYIVSAYIFHKKYAENLPKRLNICI